MDDTRAKRHLSVFLAAIVAFLLASCGGVEVAQTFEGDAAAGETLYQANCASCHGSDLRGTDRGPSHLSVVYEPSHHGDAAFLLAVRQGVREHHWDFGDMPPIDGLGDDDVAAITAYVRTVQEREGFEPYPP